MSGLKEIRRRIGSVKSTKQITRAMKLVSAAKLRRAQSAAENGLDYSRGLSRVLQRVVSDISGDLEHPLLTRVDSVTNRHVVAIAGDRGLCGPYNANVVKAILAQDCTTSAELDFSLFGRRLKSTALSNGWTVSAAYEDLAENAGEWPIDEVYRSVTEKFIAGECQEVVLYYTRFISAMTQVVVREVLLPFDQMSAGAGDGEEEAGGSVSYGAPPEEILSGLIPLLLKARMTQAGLESRASEHSARMTAMDAATSNADDLIGKLRLHYNRARQSSITSELIDIVGGAEAAG